MIVQLALVEISFSPLGLYLQSERERLNRLIHLPQGPEQDAYDKEDHVLRMEEKLLYDLVNYLQVVGFIQTNTKDS